jgi:hypothetical protein
MIFSTNDTANNAPRTAINVVLLLFGVGCPVESVNDVEQTDKLK